MMLASIIHQFHNVSASGLFFSLEKHSVLSPGLVREEDPLQQFVFKITMPTTMTNFWIIAPLCLLVPLTSAASASFQAQRITRTNTLAKHTNSNRDDSRVRASRAFIASSSPLAALDSPSNLFASPTNTLGDLTLGTASSFDSSDFLLAAGRTLEETTSKISTYSAMMEEATRKIPALDATSKISSYSTMVKGGTSSLGFDGALDGLKINLQSTTDVLQSTTDALNLEKLQNAKQAIESVAVVDPENFLRARQSLIDGSMQQLSSQESVMEFWQWYVASLNERYHFPELHESFVSGTAFSTAMNKALAIGQTAVNGLDIKHQGPVYFFIATVFWASTQGKGGIESDQPKKVAAVASGKLLPEQKIKKLEEELKSTKAEAKKESQEKSNEIKELRQQMVCHFFGISTFTFWFCAPSMLWLVLAPGSFLRFSSTNTYIDFCLAGYITDTGRGVDRSSRCLNHATGKDCCPRSGCDRGTS